MGESKAYYKLWEALEEFQSLLLLIQFWKSPTVSQSSGA